MTGRSGYRGKWFVMDQRSLTNPEMMELLMANRSSYPEMVLRWKFHDCWWLLAVARCNQLRCYTSRSCCPMKLVYLCRNPLACWRMSTKILLAYWISGSSGEGRQTSPEEYRKTMWTQHNGLPPSHVLSTAEASLES